MNVTGNTAVNYGYQPGISISDGQSIMHKLSTPFNIESLPDDHELKVRFKEGQSMMAQHAIFTSPEGINARRDSQLKMGDFQDTRAIIRIDGEVIAYRTQNDDYSGITTKNKYAGYIDNQLGGDEQGTRNFVLALKDEYGDRVEVEYFKSGEGPTHAETFEMFSGQNYVASINNGSDLELTGFYGQEEVAEQRERDRVMRNAVPQTDVLRVNDVVVGSVDVNNRFHVSSANLNQEADQLGIEREQLKNIYNYEFKDINPEDLLSLFKDVFGSAGNVNSLSKEEVPSYGEVMAKSQQQFLQRYDAIHEPDKST